MKKSEFLPGNTYFLKNPELYIIRATASGHTKQYIKPIHKLYINDCDTFIDINIYELASQEQVMWLNKCIEAGKFIPFEEIKLQPEYSVY